MGELLTPKPGIQLRKPLLQEMDVLRGGCLQRAESILVDVRDFAVLYAFKELQEPVAFLMPCFRGHCLVCSPKRGRGAVPLSRDDALDEVRLQLAAHTRRAVAAHADEAYASAYEMLDRRYADILVQAGRNHLPFVESD